MASDCLLSDGYSSCMDIQDLRRRRLAEWVTAHGGHGAVVRDRGLNTSQASFLSQVVNGYSFGERAARSMEARLGMPADYLDKEDTAAPALSPDGTPAYLAELAAKLPPERQERLVAVAELLAGPQGDKIRFSFSLAERAEPPTGKRALQR